MFSVFVLCIAGLGGISVPAEGSFKQLWTVTLAPQTLPGVAHLPWQVLAAVSGGRLSLHGQRVTKRWTRLAAPAAPGDTTISVQGDAAVLAGWTAGKEVLITSSTFNPEQAETRRILAVDSTTQPGQLQLTLDAALLWTHGGTESRCGGCMVVRGRLLAPVCPTGLPTPLLQHIFSTTGACSCSGCLGGSTTTSLATVVFATGSTRKLLLRQPLLSRYRQCACVELYTAALLPVCTAATLGLSTPSTIGQRWRCWTQTLSSHPRTVTHSTSLAVASLGHVL
jgi:hypothetical protein